MAGVERFNEAYKERDIDALLDQFVDGPDAFLYGTGADERRVGRDQVRDQAERDWAQTEAVAFEFDKPVISARGPVAWLAVDGRFAIAAGGREMKVPARVTAVFENENGTWKICQMHCSAPMAGQEEGHSF